MFISHQDIVGYTSYLNNKFHVKQVWCKCYILILCKDKESGGYSFDVCIILYWFSLMQASYAFSSFNFTIIYELLFLYLRGYVQTHGTWAELAAVLYWGDPHIQLLFHQNICLRGLQFQYFMIRLTKINPSFSCQKKSITMRRHAFYF